MLNSKPDTSLYEIYKEERLNYRLALDLKKHNWLLKKLSTDLSKPNKKEKKILKRLKKTMNNRRTRVPVIDNIDMALQRSLPRVNLTDPGIAKQPNRDVFKNFDSGVKSGVGKSMPNSIDTCPIDKNAVEIIDITSYQEKSQTRPPEKKISIKADNCKNNVLIDTKKQIISKHNLPLSTAPEMQKYRNLHQPPSAHLKQPDKYINKENESNNLLVINVSCGTQTESDEILMLNYLYSKGIKTLNMLKNAMESSQTKMLEEALNILKQIKTKDTTAGDPKDSIDNDNDDDIIFVKEEILSANTENTVQNNLSKEAVKSLVDMSTENKNFISLLLRNNICKGILAQYLYWKHKNKGLKIKDTDIDDILKEILNKQIHDNCSEKEVDNVRPEHDKTDDNSKRVVEDTSQQTAKASRQHIAAQACQQVKEVAGHVEEVASHSVAENIISPQIVQHARNIYFGAPAIPMPKPQSISRNRNNKTHVRRSNLKLPPRTDPVQENRRSYHIRDPKCKTQERHLKPQNHTLFGQNPSHSYLPSNSVFGQNSRGDRHNTSINQNLVPHSNSQIERSCAYNPSRVDHSGQWSQNSHDIVYSASSEYYGTNGTYIQNIETGHIDLSGHHSQYTNNCGYTCPSNQDGHNSAYNPVVRYDPNGQNAFGFNNINNSQHNLLSGNIQNTTQGVVGTNIHTGHYDVRISGVQSQHNDSWGPSGQPLPPMTVATTICQQQQQWPARPMANPTVPPSSNQQTRFPTTLPHQIASQHANVMPEWAWNVQK